MGYPLEKLSACCFFNKGVIRHLIIWKTLRFKALTWIWLSKVKDQLYPKKGVEFFLTPKVGVHNRVPSIHQLLGLNNIFEDLSHS